MCCGPCQLIGVVEPLLIEEHALWCHCPVVYSTNIELPGCVGLENWYSAVGLKSD